MNPRPHRPTQLQRECTAREAGAASDQPNSTLPHCRVAAIVGVVAISLAGCGGAAHKPPVPQKTSTTNTAAVAAKVQKLAACGKALTDYQTVANDMKAIGTAGAGSASAPYGQAVADTDALSTDLSLLRSTVAQTAVEQTQLEQDVGTLAELKSALQEGSAGNYQAGNASLTGVAQEIRQMPALINQTCGV